MSVVAVICARGGSKGIPRKNVRPFAGHPLIAWTIRAALAAEGVDHVVLSSEDDEILAVAEAHGALGNILAAQGNLDGAITKFEKAIEIKPNLFEAQINLGIAWEHKGESDKAHSHYKKAIRLQPQDDQAYLMLANSLYNNKKWKEAVNYYREVLKLNPELAQARENLKKAQQQAGNKNTSK